MGLVRQALTPGDVRGEQTSYRSDRVGRAVGLVVFMVQVHRHYVKVVASQMSLENNLFVFFQYLNYRCRRSVCYYVH